MANGRGASGWTLDHALEEFHLPLDDVQELLARFGRRAEADEIDRMAGVEGVADLALRLEAADARPLAGARIDHHDRPFARIGRHARRRQDAQKRIVDRPRQRPAAHHHFVIEAQHGRHRPRGDLDLLVAALPQQIEEQNAALNRIDHVGRPRVHGVASGRLE